MRKIQAVSTFTECSCRDAYGDYFLIYHSRNCDPISTCENWGQSYTMETKEIPGGVAFYVFKTPEVKE